MRIGIDARPLLRPTTGIGRYTTQILSRLAPSGHEFFLYAPQPLSGSFEDLENITVRDANLRHDRLASVSAQLRYPRWARRDTIDVFWSPRHHLPLFTSVPTVVTVHDLVWRKAPESMIALGRTLERVLMPPSVRKADAIIAVSEATRKDLLESFPKSAGKIRVIHEAAFSSERCLQNAVRSKTILFVGTFEPRKNLPGLLRAFAKLRRDEGISHKLVLAGNPGWKEDVAGLIETLGIKEYVAQVRPGSQEALEELYCACDFTVQPAFYEGFGLPILEAMSFGKPVVTSNVSSMPEVAGNAALLVDPRSIDQIAAAMLSLITDSELYETLAGRARAQASKFSWDTAAAETLEVLEAVAVG